MSKLYKYRKTNINRMFPSDPIGSLDVLFLNKVNCKG